VSSDVLLITCSYSSIINILSLLYIHDIHLLHIHAIGIPEGMTLLEFDGMSQEASDLQQPEPKVQEVQSAGEVLDEVVIDCPDHIPCNFMKGKPRSIISLPPSEMQLSTMLYIVALSDRCLMKPLAAYVPYACPESTL
jgi:hypothetical protein